VDYAARGNGLGHALLTKVESAIRDRGGRLLLIETSSTPPYVLARRLYESSGYRCEAVVHDFYAPGDDLLIYAKTLGQGGTGETVPVCGASIAAGFGLPEPVPA
jgi:ribosomal protein S18 acetylase RimI-like enzyme